MNNISLVARQKLPSKEVYLGRIKKTLKKHVVTTKKRVEKIIYEPSHIFFDFSLDCHFFVLFFMNTSKYYICIDWRFISCCVLSIDMDPYFFYCAIRTDLNLKIVCFVIFSCIVLSNLDVKPSRCSVFCTRYAMCSCETQTTFSASASYEYVGIHSHMSVVVTNNVSDTMWNLTSNVYTDRL